MIGSLPRLKKKQDFKDVDSMGNTDFVGNKTIQQVLHGKMLRSTLYDGQRRHSNRRQPRHGLRNCFKIG